MPASVERNDDPELSLQEFLEDIPPGKLRVVSGFRVSLTRDWGFANPDIQLFCGEVNCQRVQFFASRDQDHVVIDPSADVLLHYLCRL